MRPTVLVVDDEQDFKDTLSGRLRLDGYEVIAPPGIPPELQEESLRVLQSQRVDLAIVDMRQIRPRDPNDDSGRALIVAMKRQAPDLVVIAKTVYPPNPDIAIDLIRTELGETGPLAVDYLRAADLTSPGALEARVRAAFARWVRINFALSFSAEGLGPPMIARTLANVGRSSTMSVEEETELLFRRLYYEEGDGPIELRIEPLVEGKSNAKVMLATPRYTSGWREAEFVKIDTRGRIERELDNYRDYVKGQIMHRRAPHEERSAFTQRLGGFALTSLGIAPGDLQEFGDFYKQVNHSEVAGISAVVRDLFDETCGKWYRAAAPCSRSTREWIGQEFGNWRRSFAIGIDLATDGKSGDAMLSFPSAPGVLVPNPLHYLAEIILDRDYPEAVTHGDLNARNLLVDRFGKTWLIDFYHTHPSHVARDFCRLEATVLFELLESENLGALIGLSEHLANVDSLENTASYTDVPQIPEFGFATTVIGDIRGLAARALGLGRGLTDYFAICACCALKSATYKDIAPIRRRHAIVHAAKLMESLRLRV